MYNFFHIFEHKSITDIESIFQTGCRSVRDGLKPDTHCVMFFLSFTTDVQCGPGEILCKSQ